MSLSTGYQPLPGSVVLEGVSKSFADRDGGTRLVLDAVDLEVAPTEFICLIGPSGCGKTTLIRIVQGLAEATSGSVLIDGVPAASTSVDLGFVFQQDSLLPWRTVRANIALPLELRRWDRRKQRERVDDLIELVGLSGFDKHFPHEISGGMRQRANLARALASNPEVLIMDEPFASLDSFTREQMQDELLRIWAEEKKTVLFVTHQIDEAVLLADRVVTMTAGPGRIKQITEIPLPRPRTADTRREPIFKEKVEELWQLLHQPHRSAHAAG